MPGAKAQQGLVVQPGQGVVLGAGAEAGAEADLEQGRLLQQLLLASGAPRHSLQTQARPSGSASDVHGAQCMRWCLPPAAGGFHLVILSHLPYCRSAVWS